ncbi:MAG: M1 family metallopeptidase, partial [Chloroflexi bacterium]|nr:M1 family metallopeptidase [Chloroflexota bacterium]
MPESKAILLPTNVQPEKYTLTLEPDLKAFTFNGSEKIDIEVLEATDTITMNSVEIEVNSCSIIAADGSEASAGRISYDEKQESVSFHFDGEIPVGKATISLEFVGELNDRLRGFYRSQYTDIDGNERYMATTQFESTDARRAFPCWDEPSLKARIELTVVVPVELTAVSNMPVLSEVDVGPDKRSVRFGESPIMSTYLLVIVVGDLSLIEQEAPNGTLVRIFTMRGRQEQGRFALETSIRLLGYYNEYFGILYPLPKLDHLAIPDFAAGAMENWGAITYRESALLVDPDNTSAGTRQTVAGIIAHEMAHMWFGDLVTMSWWNDLWLNESFASWMGDKATDSLFPEWEVWTQFVSADTNRGLSLDGLRSSHPIEQEVNDPAGIEQLFDAISYSKGAAVLRMLESYIGADDFRAGLHDYLTKHQYSNAKTVDLWNALGAASGQPVADVMNTWTSQMGYPVLETSIRRDATGIEVSLSQRRFVYEDILSDETDDSLWRVPIRVDTADHPEASAELVSERTGTIKVGVGRSGPSVWVKVNPEQTGFYRVKYDSEDLQRLIGPIQDGSLPAPDRLGIQNDAYALSRAGMISATDFLTIAEAYKNETSALV